jgi:cytochrome c peroxidase
MERAVRFAAFSAGALAGFAALASVTLWHPTEGAHAQQAGGDPLSKLKAQYARPAFVPRPPGDAPAPAVIALGMRLFNDKALSSTGTIACASCHDPNLSFTDGERTGKGVTGTRLARHTPTLWNVAFSPFLFWDGRALSLEDQVRFPIEHPDEMGDTLDNGMRRLSQQESYRAAFREAFGDDRSVTAARAAQALAAYERTPISPPTRFDRWIAGDTGVLTESEVNGFHLFNGRAKCSTCHTGFALTDYNFYDIGLPGTDKGRGKEIGLPAADYAFKTPTLRELAWTAPYMHDGSRTMLDDVIRHYEQGGVRRRTRSTDLPRNLKLNAQERDDLIAFLQALSSDAPPKPSTEAWVGAGRPEPLPLPSDATVVSQAGKKFSPRHIRIATSQSLTILNDDTRTHNVRIFDPRLDFNSGAQEPHERITIAFPDPGTFEAFCSIHPSMRLSIEVK